MKHASSSDDTSPANRAGLPEPALAADAVGLVLKPLARLMIDHGLQLPSMMELLKKALVEEAVASFGLADKGTSDTRIALLTGVHRKDVKRLRDAHADSAPPVTTVPLAATVVARWISEPRYLLADNTPRALARTPRRGNAGEPDFTTLVAEVSSDLGSRAVMDELLRLGVVDLVDGDFLALKSTAFVPNDGQRESFQFLSGNVSDHLATAVHNLSPHRAATPMLEQSAFSAGLSPEQADQLHQLARKLWAGALQQFLQSATVAEARSEQAEGDKHRIRFGVYFHETVQSRAVTEPVKPSPSRKTKRTPRS